MSCDTDPLTLWRGESRSLLLTIVDPTTALPVDLTELGGTYELAACEFEVKAAVEDGDPALVSKTIANGGVVVLPQTGDTLGQVRVGIAPGDWATVAPGLYWYDVVAVLASGARLYVVKPSKLHLKGVVNQP